MILILFLLLQGAWCAGCYDEIEELDSPSTWQNLEKDLGEYKEVSSHGALEEMGEFSVTRDKRIMQSDYIVLKKERGTLTCNLWHNCIGDAGEILDLGRWTYGKAVHFGSEYQMRYDSESGRVTINDCRGETPEQELFVLKGLYRTEVFSEYSAFVNGLSLKRIFGADGNEFFVKVHMIYNDLDKVTVSWGSRDVYAVQGVGSENTQGSTTLNLARPEDEDMDMS